MTRVRALMEDACFWGKGSGSERISREVLPFHDAARYGRLLVERFHDRVLWGTDWPHPNISKNMPDDGALVDLLEVIAPRPRQRPALLVDNPMRLYWPDRKSTRLNSSHSCATRTATYA